MISEYNKLALKEHKTRHNWMGKRFTGNCASDKKIDHTEKGYTHKQEFF